MHLFLLLFGFNIGTCTCQVCGITLWRSTQKEYIEIENSSIFLSLTNDKDSTEPFQFQFSTLPPICIDYLSFLRKKKWFVKK